MWLLILILAILICLAFKDSLFYWQKRNVPHAKSHFLFGFFVELFAFKRSMGAQFARIYADCDGRFRGTWVLNKPALFVKDPHLIKRICVKDFKHFADRYIASDARSDAVAANFLLTANNPLWRRSRQTTSPIFTANKLRLMTAYSIRAGRNLIEYIATECCGGRVAAVAVDRPKRIVYDYVAESLINSIFSVETAAFRNPNNEFVACIELMKDYKTNVARAFQMSCYFFAPALVTLFKLKLFNPATYAFVEAVVTDTMAERRRANVTQPDLVNVLMQMQESSDVDQNKIVATAFQFFAAGFETVTETITCALYELSFRADIRKRLRDEIERVIPNGADGMDYDNVGKIKYLNNVIKETMRKYPTLPFLDRLCIEDYKVPDSDLIIEKGVPIYISLLGLHLDPKYFPDPDTFDPDRFEEDKDEMRNLVYLPFGSGPRHCIGERFAMLQMQIALISIVTKFDVRNTDQTPRKLEFHYRSFLLDSTSPLHLQFVKIDKD